jgi:hypothetical protein
MKHIRLALIDNDYAVQAEGALDVNEKQNSGFARFIDQIREELTIGQTATLEIEGLTEKPVSFTIAQAV